MKSYKMGSNDQIFASLLAKKVVLKHMKHIIMLKQISRNGIVRCFEFALNDL